MKKVALALATACVVAVSAVGVAFAGGGGGTVVDSGFACNVFDGNGNLFVTTNSVLTVYSNQQGAKAVLQCEGNGAGAPSLTFYNFANTGLACGTAFGATLDWSNKVGRNGNSQLTCTVTAGNDAPAASGGVSGIG